MSMGPIAFSESLIQGGCRYVFGVAAADINGDGNVDLVAADIREIDGERKSDLYWFENDGSGAFRRHLISGGQEGWFERHDLGDISGNGWPDVVIVNNRDGEVVWFENDGDPSDGPWRRHVVTTAAPRAYDVVLADLDGDGRLDVAVSGYASGLVSWYRNPGSELVAEWPQHIIDDSMREARTMRAGDLNGNGRIDLLCTAVGTADGHDSCVAWYENPGPPAGTWTKHVIDDQTPAPVHGQAVDMDGDGEIDVVMAFGMRSELVPPSMHEVAWYENLGGARAWRKHRIGALPYAFEAIAADLTGTGTMDVIASAWSLGDCVVWFENDGDPRGAPRGTWTKHEVRSDWPAANQVIAADLTGDGRPDLVATADDGSRRVTGANEIRWWRNVAR